MKTLIVYYSKTGNTQIIAKELAQNLNADLEELIETNPKDGVVWMVMASKDAILRNGVAINDLKHQVADYDLVIVGTPVWAWSMASPVRGFIEKYKQNLKKVAFFATMGNTGDKQAFTHMEKLSGLAPVATVSFTDGKIKNGEFKEVLKVFVENINT